MTAMATWALAPTMQATLLPSRRATVATTFPMRMLVCISTTTWACRSVGPTSSLEAGIETVADLVGHTEDDLLRIEGIGTKAIEELKEGLEKHGLSHVIEDDLNASRDDMSQLLDMVFSPDDTVLIGRRPACNLQH